MAIRAQKELLHKVPPHNIEAEQAVLGGILIEKDAINKVLELLPSDGSDFYHNVHARIFCAMVDLFDKNIPIDIVTLADQFKGSEVLSAVGGLSYIGEIVEATPTAANIMYYARIVHEKALLRKIISASTDIVTRGYEGVESADEFIDEAERSIFQVSQDRAKKSFFALKDIIKDAFETIEKLYERKSHITGVATGFK
ncbi:MAG: DnaB-like helicase N-terminal domain-containing protein, partial [Deltaproteobacteria bacterium]|nr:DnaB-like helicase N-terminal domain-containing protein [Deltaproteobacteria bacterium]